MKSSEYAQVDKKLRGRNGLECNEVFKYLGADIHTPSFTSNHANHLLGRSRYECATHGLVFFEDEAEEGILDYRIEENIRFRYPLVREPAKDGAPKRHDRAIVLLHGLNERSFTKFIPWGLNLQRSTGTPVLLFPLAFHMNRGQPGWAASQNETYRWRQRLPSNDCSHRFNALISDRLDRRPERFFWGVVQTYLDLVDLVRQIRGGLHPHFSEGARVDFLGYSAGGYVALLLLLDDLEGLFSSSRAVIFGSGVALRDLNLSSPMILDSSAETALFRTYGRQIDQLPGNRMKHWFECHGEGIWFRAMAGLKANSALTEPRLKQIAPRVLGIANTNDSVTPAGAMLNSLQGLRRDTGVEVAELSLGLHESPFVAADYGKSCRRLVVEVLDEEHYGRAFDDFIKLCANHLSR